MRTTTVVILTPEREIILSEICSLVIECPDGERGILPGHAPSIVELAIGVMRCTTKKKEELYFALGGGVAEITPNKVLLIVHSAEEAHEIDVERAKEAALRAKRRLEERTPGVDFVRAQAALLRSLARLKAAEVSQKARKG